MSPGGPREGGDATPRPSARVSEPPKRIIARARFGGRATLEVREDFALKVEHYNAIVRAQMSRRNMLKGAASVGAVAAMGGV
jgi:hypothetical protein